MTVQFLTTAVVVVVSGAAAIDLIWLRERSTDPVVRWLALACLTMGSLVLLLATRQL